MPFITELLLPKQDNQGRPFATKHYRAFQARLIRQFGRWTRKGHAAGAWQDPSGEVVTDAHWVYEVGHARRELRFWKAEKERLKAEFAQEEIWIIQYDGRRI